MNKTKFSFTTKDIMSCRNELYGIATVLILIFHIARVIWDPYIDMMAKNDLFYSFLNNYLTNFRVGVDVFVILSPIGLYHSMQKNSVKTFYFNRFKRVVVPCLIMFIPYYIWFDFFYRSDLSVLKHTAYLASQSPFLHRLLLFFSDVTTVSYWIPKVPYSFWYISFIIIMYALYPLLYMLDKKTKHISTAVLLVLSVIFTIHTNITADPYLLQIETLTSRLHVFFIGMLLSPLLSKEYKIPWWVVLISFALWGVAVWQILVWCSGGMFRFIGTAVALLSVITFAFLMKWGKKVMYYLNTPFRFIGRYSLEIYVLHLMLYNIGCFIDEEISPMWIWLPNSVWILIALAIAIPVGMLVQKIAAVITKKKRPEVKIASNN